MKMTVILRTVAVCAAFALVTSAQAQTPPSSAVPEASAAPEAPAIEPTVGAAPKTPPDAPEATTTTESTTAPEATTAQPETAETTTPPDKTTAATKVPDEEWEPEGIPASNDDLKDRGLETIVSAKSRKRVAGSAHRVSQKELEQMESDDINRVLKRIPGVNVREEDGYGLRPNIGMRGTSSDRSSKVVLLEDGVLFGPAPYAAPAAYYFPMMQRMVGVEVFKGPAAIRHGPNTIGGALNLMTRPVPSSFLGELDLGAGSFGTKRAHGVVGFGNDGSGVLLEMAHIDTDGFKEIDRLPGQERQPTGFERNDVMVKARLGSSWLDSTRHALELKLSYGDEDSHETYLGLTDDDIAAQPYRRYLGSAADHMQWNRFGGQLGYSFVVDGAFDVKVTAYRHDFHRAWRRANRFLQGPSLESLLLNPDAGQNAVFMGVLRGDIDSENAGQTIGIATNDRTYVSQGVQSVAHVTTSLFSFASNTEFGLRLHNDSITRLHTEDGLRMISGQLVPDGRETAVTTANTASALAMSAWIVEELQIGSLTVLPGARLELIGTQLEERTDFLLDKADAPAVQDDLQVAVLPGIGLAYDLPFSTVFGGVHRGFSPRAPGQTADVKAEASWNVELGGRSGVKSKDSEARAEVVGFYSPYENIVGQCTLSAGCVDDGVFAQENGGAALVAGVEASVGASHAFFERAKINADLVYTFTHATFSTTFNSGSALYGDVLAGDYLPYVPMHQTALSVGADVFGLSAGVIASYVSEMRDLPGQGERGANGKDTLSGETFSDPLFNLDVNVGYEVWQRGVLYLRLDNVTGTEAVVAHRPFGARPNKPTAFLIGFKQKF